MEAVLVSSGAIAALLDAGSPLHRQARDVLKELRDREAVPTLTNFIMAETFSVLSDALGPDAARTWLRHNIWPVERVSEADEERAREIVLEAANNDTGGKIISYTDATSIAVMERLGIARAITFDPLFEGWEFRPGTGK